MATNNKPNTNDKIGTKQVVLLGVAAAFYVLYKFGLKDPQIKSDMGVAYPWVVMVWLIIMFFCAGLSGSKLIDYLPKIKEILNKKSDNE